MKKTLILLAGIGFSFALATCTDGSSENTSTSRTSQAPIEQSSTDNRPSPDVPETNTPETNTPEINTLEINVPEVNIPNVNLPTINFPEITVPEVVVQQGDNTTIYTLAADVLFDFDKDAIRPDAEVALQQVSGSIAQRFLNSAIQINGHTDSIGTDAYNLDLSQRRAESVKQWLASNGGNSSSRMTINGLGESQPVAPNTNSDNSDNPAGRQRNRRVEIIVRGGSSTP
ncbi:MAG: OmpA family protein [Leptolyngbyaceae cyanobacterium SL_5_9]|nr:OmpA family protein [Leptolyngbyaceae cyanobacterium SL_5_9]NJO75297.1 OmpA family protein [Leptolyngbyaceae cyanobacterium RM1_406_9]